MTNNTHNDDCVYIQTPGSTSADFWIGAPVGDSADFVQFNSPASSTSVQNMTFSPNYACSISNNGAESVSRSSYFNQTYLELDNQYGYFLTRTAESEFDEAYPQCFLAGTSLTAAVIYHCLQKHGRDAHIILNESNGTLRNWCNINNWSYELSPPRNIFCCY